MVVDFLNLIIFEKLWIRYKGMRGKYYHQNNLLTEHTKEQMQELGYIVKKKDKQKTPNELLNGNDFELL